MKPHRLVLFSALFALPVILLTGCATHLDTLNSGPGQQSLALQGRVFGGQQPVAFSSLALVEVSTAGYGTLANNSLLQTPRSTDAQGNFDITGDYTCVTGSDQLYILALGGNPGVGGTHNNSALALMAALGRCDAAPNLPYIFINELSTVAAVWSAAPFMTSLYGLSTSASNTQGVAHAFDTANRLVSLTTGAIGGPGLPATATLPVSEINTLADILAICINTVDDTGTGAPSSECQSVFAATTVGGIAPSDTVSAALNLAHNPTLGLSLGSMVTAISPYHPTLTGAPSSWTIAINYTGGGLSQPQGIATDSSGNVWLANSTNNSVSKFDPAGAPLSGSAGFAPAVMSAPSAITIDTSGNAWVANSGNNTLTMIAASGSSGASYSGGGLSTPKSVAIDAAGYIWLANSGTNSVSEFSSAGTPVSGTSGFTGSGLASPAGIAIDPR